MAYVEPSAATLKARLPEFAPVADALVDLVLADAIGRVGETWLERDRGAAQVYLAAHMLAMEGEPGRSVAIAAGGSGAGAAVNGPMKRRKVGDVEVEFAGASELSGGRQSAKSKGGYENTEYGRRYLDLMARNFFGVAVV